MRRRLSGFKKATKLYASGEAAKRWMILMKLLCGVSIPEIQHLNCLLSFLFLHAVTKRCLLSFLTFCFCGASAQHPYYYSISDDNGLPSNEVYDMFQDSIGFMWLGTNAGLYRYDGTDFMLINSAEQKGKAISHLSQDKTGKLWCQNFSGQIYSVSGDSLHLEYDWSGKKANFPVFIFDAENRLCITSDSGLYRANSKNQFTFFNVTDMVQPFSDVSISDLHSFQGKLFLANRNKIGYIQHSRLVLLRSISHPELLNDITISISFHEINNKLYALSRDQKQNTLWLISNDSIIWQRRLPVTVGRLYSLHNNYNTRLWVGGSNGVVCLDTNLRDQFDGRLLFSGKSVSKVLLDKEGNYWVSTLQDGIFVLPSTEVWIHTHDNSPLNDSRIRQLANDNQGNLFIGYQNGKLSRYHLRSNTIHTLSFDNTPTDIQLLYVDSSNYRLIVGQNKTWAVDTRTMAATPIQGISNIKAMAKERDGQFLTGTVMGTILGNPKPKAEIIRYLRRKRTRAVYYDPTAKKRWVAYVDGLWVSNNETEIELKWNKKSLNVTDIAQLADGTIWVSTLDNGVLGFQDTLCFRQILADIPHGFVRKLAADGNSLWIAAEDKLICYDTKNKASVSYNRFDGLPSLEIADIEFIDDKVLIATPKGLVEIPRAFNSINTVPPTVFISGFAVHEKDTTLTHAYQLGYTDNNIRIAFRGISFRSQGQFTYKYRLLGLDSAWILTNSRSNFARYPSLPAGKYLFEVKALNEDGMESTHAATIAITVLKPFWQQWWFYLLCGLILVSVVSLAFALRIRYIRKRSELEKRMVSSQLSALKSQMNPHFMFNALNSIQDLVLQQDTVNAQLYLGKFSELTRAVLNASGEEFISLKSEVEMLSLYLDLEKLRFGTDCRFELSIDESLDTEEIQLPSMIIQPFVENAIKHGLLHKNGQKSLLITFGAKQNALICVVEDNGVGRAVAEEINARKKKHKSFATQATAERLRLLNEYYGLKIELETIDKSQGTKVVIEIPQRI